MAATKRKKTAAKRPAAKKSTAKKRSTATTRVKTVRAKKKTTATAKKTSSKAAKPAGSMNVKVSDPFKKSELMTTVSEMTGTSKKEVAAMLEALSVVIGEHIKKKGPGQFTLPGLLKVVINKKPATKARKGINPFTGEETMFKAKPARRVVKIRALKNLKEMAEKA